MIRLQLVSRTAALSALLLGLLYQGAAAAPLAAGEQIIGPPFEPDPVGGTLLAQVTSPFTGAGIQGQVISSVYSGESNSLGGFTFTYQVLMAAASPHAVSGFSVGNYGGFLTDVSYNNVGALDVIPFLANRSGAPGDVIRFTYFPGIDQGESSALMVVQTDASRYQPSVASVINAGSAEVQSLAPTAVPEPALAALGILGGFAILGLRWQRRR